MSTTGKSEQEWREQLTPEQYHVMRQRGTERPFTGAYVDSKQDGIYRCAACGAELFDANAKFDSGTGWPSFCEPANREERQARCRQQPRHGAHRGQLRECGGHLGHVFDDGPAETGSASASTRWRSTSSSVSRNRLGGGERAA